MGALVWEYVMGRRLSLALVWEYVMSSYLLGALVGYSNKNY